jgi:hypothetical protein
MLSLQTKCKPLALSYETQQNYKGWMHYWILQCLKENLNFRNKTPTCLN